MTKSLVKEAWYDDEGRFHVEVCTRPETDQRDPGAYCPHRYQPSKIVDVSHVYRVFLPPNGKSYPPPFDRSMWEESCIREILRSVDGPQRHVVNVWTGYQLKD